MVTGRDGANSYYSSWDDQRYQVSDKYCLDYYAMNETRAAAGGAWASWRRSRDSFTLPANGAKAERRVGRVQTSGRMPQVRRRDGARRIGR